MEETTPAAQPPAEPDVLTRTEAAVKALAEENKKMEENIKKSQELISRQILSGRAEAGTPPPSPPKEETAKEYTARIMRGELTDDEKAKRAAKY